MPKTCRNCQEYKNCRDSSISWIFFIIGIIAATAIRVVTFLIHFSPFWGDVAWYVGVVGFFIFFIYKYSIEQSRAK